MEEQEKIRAAKLIHEKARYYRGRFLNSVACIEHDIAHILTEYFCTSDPLLELRNKLDKYKSLLVGRTSTRGDTDVTIKHQNK